MTKQSKLSSKEIDILSIESNQIAYKVGTAALLRARADNKLKLLPSMSHGVYRGGWVRTLFSSEPLIGEHLVAVASIADLAREFKPVTLMLRVGHANALEYAEADSNLNSGKIDHSDRYIYGDEGEGEGEDYIPWDERQIGFDSEVVTAIRGVASELGVNVDDPQFEPEPIVYEKRRPTPYIVIGM